MELVNQLNYDTCQIIEKFKNQLFCKRHYVYGISYNPLLFRGNSGNHITFYNHEVVMERDTPFDTVIRYTYIPKSNDETIFFLTDTQYYLRTKLVDTLEYKHTTAEPNQLFESIDSITHRWYIIFTSKEWPKELQRYKDDFPKNIDREQFKDFCIRFLTLSDH